MCVCVGERVRECSVKRCVRIAKVKVILKSRS